MRKDAMRNLKHGLSLGNTSISSISTEEKVPVRMQVICLKYVKP